MLSGEPEFLEGNVDVVKSLLNLLWDLVYSLTGEGSWRLRPHEEKVLIAAFSFFDDEIQKCLHGLLSCRIFVQRSNKKVSLPRFYCRLYVRSARPLSGLEFEDNVINVRIAVRGKTEIAQVAFFCGGIESIQFKEKPEYYSSQVVQIVSVFKGNPDATHAAARDRMEHGKEP
jgi:hypothetical protein